MLQLVALRARRRRNARGRNSGFCRPELRKNEPMDCMDLEPGEVHDTADGRHIWERAFHRFLKQSPVAEKAYFRLKQACGTDNLLRYLYFYTCPLDEPGKRARTAARRTAKDLKRTLTALGKADKEIRSLIHWLTGDATLRMEIGLDLQRHFDNAWLTYLDRLKKLHNEYVMRSSLKGALRDELNVVLLSLRMQHKTNEAHWVDLAYVLNAAYEAQGTTVDVDQAMIRQIFRRYRKAHSEKVELYRKSIQRGAFFWGADEGQPHSYDRADVAERRKKK